MERVWEAGGVTKNAMYSRKRELGGERASYPKRRHGRFRGGEYAPPFFMTVLANTAMRGRIRH
jgi:hypothetical protein